MHSSERVRQTSDMTIMTGSVIAALRLREPGYLREARGFAAQGRPWCAVSVKRTVASASVFACQGSALFLSHLTRADRWASCDLKPEIGADWRANELERGVRCRRDRAPETVDFACELRDEQGLRDGQLRCGLRARDAVPSLLER